MSKKYKVYVEKDDTFKNKWNVVIQKGEKWWAFYVGTKKKCQEIADELIKGFDYLNSKD